MVAAPSPRAPRSNTSPFQTLQLVRQLPRPAYKAKVRESHPDTNRDDPEAKEKFQKLNDANQVLSGPDPKKKAEYDRKTVADN